MSEPDSVAVPSLQDEEGSSSQTLPPPSPEPMLKSASIATEEQSRFTFSMWPPTQRTRDAVINRLIETLSTTSVVTKRYGTMPHDEASSAARLIEDEAFATAGSASAAEVDGIEILNLYSKEISKRMLEMVKARASAASAASAEENGVLQNADSSVISTTTSEEISTMEKENES